MMGALATTAMTLGELLGAAAADVSGIEITDLVMDSRQVRPGAAFVAVPGARSHGLEYVEEAVRRGASVVLFEPDPDSSPRGLSLTTPSLEIPDLRDRLGALGAKLYPASRRLAGITGTNGKSTVAFLVAQAQTLRGTPCAYMGTVGAGIPPDLTPQELTTPDCLTLHRTLHSFQTHDATLEVSSHALAQNRIAGLVFDTAVFTNLSRDHLDYHGDLDAYQAAKARLFELEGLRHAVIFVDDPFGVSLADRLAESVEQIGVSLQSAGRLRGTILDSGMRGISVQVSGPLIAGAQSANAQVLTSPLIGDFNAENLLLALGVLLSWDVPLVEACQALSACSPLPGRMEAQGGAPNEPWAVVDYAHTPAALERALLNLRDLTGGEIWCVFGCGGERDQGKRALMGAAAARLADHIVLTDDNPRGEDPGAIVADIRAAIIDHPDVWIEHDRARAIQEAISRAGAGDVVLVAGKGHEAWQWVAGERNEFSDRAVVQAALGGEA